jgi:hypothetical protein
MDVAQAPTGRLDVYEAARDEDLHGNVPSLLLEDVTVRKARSEKSAFGSAPPLF